MTASCSTYGPKWEFENLLTIPKCASTDFCTPVPANGGKRAALLQLLHESPAAEFTDGDGAKCNLISARINHLVLFFWRAICLERFSYRGRCPVTKKKKLRWGEKEGGQTGESRTMRTATNPSFFAFFFLFLLRSLLPLC